MRRIGSVVLGVVLAALLTTSAKAADAVYWTNSQAPFGVWWLALPSGGTSNLGTNGFTFTGPAAGLAFDAAAGRAYWVNTKTNTISYTLLDGSGTKTLATPGVPLVRPIGIAIDPVAGRLYIADANAQKIRYVRVDGSGGGDVTTTGATVSSPYGVAVDPDEGRVYWTNNDANKISYAALDGSGGANLDTTGAPVSSPIGVAVDPAAARVYWSSYGTNQIGYADTKGGSAGALNTSGAPMGGPAGIAIDAENNRLFWGNFGSVNALSIADLDGNGGADAGVPSTTRSYPFAVALLRAPQNTAAPAVTGAGAVGSTLNCSDGTWAKDIPSSFLSRAPQTLTYAWSRNDSLIREATTATLTTTQAGTYKCLVTAKNYAGLTQQPSAAVTVGGAGDPNPPGNVSLQLSITGRTLKVWTSVPGALTITAGEKTRPINRSLTGGEKLIRFVLTPSATQTLRRNGRLSIIFTAKFVPTNGGRTAIAQKSTLLD